MPPRASLKSNVLANYVGQFYVAGINVLLLPIQIGLLGTEAYGLVGFFAMLSGWLQLLDLGLSPTLARETAKYRAGVLDKVAYGELLRAIQTIFLCLGVLISVLVFTLSGPLSRHWLHGTTLTPSVVANAVALMGLVFAFRWQATLSRSVLVGLERQVWVNALNAAFATLRSVGVLAVLWVQPTPRAFFVYQTVIAAAELMLLRIVVRRSLALGPVAGKVWSFAPLRRIAGFSLTVALVSSVWVSVTQVDSLLLSKFLPLSEYAWFTVATMAANGINLLSGPIGQAVQPRLTYFFAMKDSSGLRTTYADATQMLSAIALTGSFTVAMAARPLLWAWTGNATLADRTAPVLAFYGIGNGLLAVVAMTYYLQVAHGDLRLHLKGNVVFAVLQLPLVVVATLRAGMLGASLAWCAANVVFFAVWTLIVHHRFLPGIHSRWLVVDVALPCLVGLLPTPLLLCPFWSSLSRLQTIFALAFVGLLSVGMASLATRPVRRFIRTLKTRSMVA